MNERATEINGKTDKVARTYTRDFLTRMEAGLMI